MQFYLENESTNELWAPVDGLQILSGSVPHTTMRGFFLQVSNHGGITLIKFGMSKSVHVKKLMSSSFYFLQHIFWNEFIFKGFYFIFLNRPNLNQPRCTHVHQCLFDQSVEAQVDLLFTRQACSTTRLSLWKGWTRGSLRVAEVRVEIRAEPDLGEVRRKGKGRTHTTDSKGEEWGVYCTEHKITNSRMF